MTQPAGIRKAERFAAIDVGSNSVKLSIAVRGNGGRPTIIDTARIVSQLGQHVDQHGQLETLAIERTAEAILHVADEARSQDTTHIRAIATSAAREAPNADTLRDRVQALAGLELEIISGDREADLAFQAVSSHHVVDGQPSLVFDTGGGSTEIVVANDNAVQGKWSVPVGALRLTGKFDSGGRVSVQTMASIRAHVREQVTASGVHTGAAEVAVGIGGTCAAMALMDIGPLPVVRSGKPPAILREQHTMSLATIEEMVTWLGRMDLAERKDSTGLRSRRAEIIVSGACIIAELLSMFEMDQVAMLDVGLRDGLLLEMMHQA